MADVSVQMSVLRSTIQCVHGHMITDSSHWEICVYLTQHYVRVGEHLNTYIRENASSTEQVRFSCLY